MSVSWRRVFGATLFILAVLATIFAMFCAEERWRWRRAWQQYAKEAKQRGVQLERNNTPDREIPDELNAAKVPYFTTGLQDHARDVIRILLNMSDPEGGMRANMAVAKEALVTSGFMEADELPAHISMRNLFERELATAWTDISTAAKRPYLQSPLTDKDGMAYRQMPDLLGAFQLGAIHAKIRIAEGKPAAARETVETLFSLVRLIDQDPSPLSAMIKVICMDHVTNTVWSGLAQAEWDDDTLLALQKSFAGESAIRSWRSGFKGERQYNNAVFRKALAEGLSKKQMMDLFGLRWRPRLAALYPRGWIYRNQLLFNRYLDERDRCVEDRDIIGHPEHSIRAALSANPILDALWAGQITHSADFMGWMGENEIRLRQASAACALERYRRSHGEYPEDMQTLMVSGFISSIPKNPTGASAMDYVRERPDMYVLTGRMELLSSRDGKTSVMTKTWKPAPRQAVAQ